MMKRYRVNFSPDEGAGGGVVPPADGSGAGDQGAAGGDAPAGWVAALTDDQKGNEYVKGFTKAPDFVAASLDLKTQHEALLAKSETAIFKPGENAAAEDIAAYHKALGVPESADKYEFPKTEGIEQDEKMLGWAREVFHKHGISQEAAAGITKEWDGFMQSMTQAHEEAAVTAEQEGITAADNALKEKWGTDYDKNKTETQRGYQAFEKIVPGFAEFLALETKGGVAVGNDSRMLEVFHAVGKAIGDDLSFPSVSPGGQAPADKKGFESIYKTKNPARE